MAQLSLEDHLHPRLLGECLTLYQGGHYKHATLEAMQAVEHALLEKGIASAAQAFGVRLVRATLGRSQHIMLSLELNQKMQDAALKMFEGAFSFYRNYAAHAGEKIDGRVALRVMMLASELLDLVGASRRSFTGMGGLEGLLEHNFFESAREVADCLRFLDGSWCSDIVPDGWLEDKAAAGVSDAQVEVAFDLDLVMATDIVREDPTDGTSEIITSFNLTDLGHQVLRDAEAKGRE